MEVMKVILTLIEPMLGTTSGNSDVTKEFIVSKHPDGPAEDEIEAAEAISADEDLKKSSTYFPKEDGVPFVWDYQIKGFFKDACSMLRRSPGKKSKVLKAHRKVIDGLIFPSPRKIPFVLSGSLEWKERPLRGQTAQGERIALVRSEMAPPGSVLMFDIKFLDPALRDVIIEWLDYGELRGIGQWRNSGMGRFSYEIA